MNQWGLEHMGRDYSYIGAVIGATYPEMGKALRKLMPRTFFLVPGYGAQGASAADLADFFGDDGLGAIVNSSRGIIFADKTERFAVRAGEEARALQQAMARLLAEAKVC